ncbi:hypothetical protein NE686_17310 [Tissierella carlieri]|uniref:Uncharacterized protein n=1 Tax=Tissierella carlieri TaxID=689904 RepID=A0ABT1SEF0_9FIRM|nr:hypothetical protein [Tissierella carlieri]MCQ4924864.1 hypothetical protein [Tissierella carlieri]
MKNIFRKINNEKGFGQFLAFLFFMIPTVLILLLIASQGEYWSRNPALDNVNKQFIATVCKRGEDNIEETISTYINNLESVLGENNYKVVVKGKINGVSFYDESLDFLKNKKLGRNRNRQDVIGAYVESKKNAFISNIVNFSVGWFSYTGDDSDIKYRSFYEGEVEPWLDE